MSDQNDSPPLHIHDAVKVASGANLREYARDRLELAKSIWTHQRDMLRREAAVPQTMQDRLEQQRSEMERQRAEIAERFGTFEGRPD